MFFYIGNNNPLQSLTQVDDRLFIDQGWEQTSINDVQVWYKGYSTECTLSSSIDKIVQGYRPRGKWCAIVKQDNKFIIKCPYTIGFPLNVLDDQVTNLKLSGFEKVVEYITAPKAADTISLNDAVDQIQQILISNVVEFYHYNSIDKMNVIFSGGLDTLTSWAVLDHVNPNYNLDVYIPKSEDKILSSVMDSTSDYGSDLIDHVRKSYWGYQISRFYSKKNWNITGYYAERIQMREVTNGIAIAKYLKKPMNELLEQSDYLYWFLQRPNIKEMKIDLPEFPDEKSVKDWCYCTIQNDYQMWHLDNNLHFSPFYDSRITDVMYNLSVEDILLNLRHGLIQKRIVQNVRPEFTQLLSDYKNSKDVFGNFKKNWQNVKLSPLTKVTVR